mmetsp:Transcript_10985/g.31528  ORF Transcript_10985/g.31528 Transcript_10985/m.31528 type:complete len:257 (-) Transcript_10985:206-976(-)
MPVGPTTSSSSISMRARFTLVCPKISLKVFIFFHIWHHRLWTFRVPSAVVTLSVSKEAYGDWCCLADLRAACARAYLSTAMIVRCRGSLLAAASDALVVMMASSVRIPATPSTDLASCSADSAASSMSLVSSSGAIHENPSWFNRSILMECGSFGFAFGSTAGVSLAAGLESSSGSSVVASSPLRFCVASVEAAAACSVDSLTSSPVVLATSSLSFWYCARCSVTHNTSGMKEVPRILSCINSDLSGLMRRLPLRL